MDFSQHMLRWPRANADVVFPLLEEPSDWDWACEPSGYRVRGLVIMENVRKNKLDNKIETGIAVYKSL